MRQRECGESSGVVLVQQVQAQKRDVSVQCIGVDHGTEGYALCVVVTAQIYMQYKETRFRALTGSKAHETLKLTLYA